MFFIRLREIKSDLSVEGGASAQSQTNKNDRKKKNRVHNKYAADIKITEKNMKVMIKKLTFCCHFLI